ncbi:DDE-type integrase/transposase/recombinase [Gallaecimonas kandeliae]|uniref:DDE-type integrase/transposase/recombinase n=1 Tax=Gallaecimonas kandeliae TaxID=3029055 RepID=UPI003AF32B2A
MLIVQAASTFCAPYEELRQLVSGQKAFCEAYNKHELELPSWIYKTVGSVSFMSVRRWQTTLEKEGPAALAGRYKADKQHKVEAVPEMADFLKALVTSKPHLANKWRQLHSLLEVYVNKQGLPWEIPSPSSIRRWLVTWIDANKVAFTFTTNPKGFNNKYRTAVERMYPWMAAPNDVWEFDSTPVDAMLKEGRHSIIAVIDCYTRRVKLLVSPTSNSEGICLLLRKTLLSWGTVNEGGLIRTDNGSDYVSTRTTSICSLLGLEVSRAAPYSGWEKPFIERFFRTLSHDLIELLPGFIGHNVADREVIEACKEFAKRLAEKRKPEAEREGFELRLTRDELQQFLDNWVEAFYHRRAHDGLNGRTPFEVYQGCHYQPRMVNDAEALDILLNHAGTAVVLKGFVKVGGLRYTAPELLEHEWKAKKVTVFLDPSDVGRAFIYREGDWTHRVEAVDADMLGREISPDAYRTKKREEAKSLRGFRRQMQDLAKTFGVDELHKDLVDQFTEQAKQLVAMPKPTQDHGNEAIQALSGAADRIKNPLSNQFSDAELEHLAAKREAFQKRQEELHQQQGLLLRNEHDKARHLARESLHRTLTPKEEAFLDQYKKGNQFGAKEVEKIMAGRHQGNG